MMNCYACVVMFVMVLMILLMMKEVMMMQHQCYDAKGDDVNAISIHSIRNVSHPGSSNLLKALLSSMTERLRRIDAQIVQLVVLIHC